MQMKHVLEKDIINYIHTFQTLDKIFLKTNETGKIHTVNLYDVISLELNGNQKLLLNTRRGKQQNI